MSAAPARKQPLEPGRTVASRYLVRRVLGEGGMGQVLEVEHVALGRPFALKVLRLERWNDELVRRFNREARALAKLSTPRVAQVTDFGVEEDVGPYYVMELLEGETLEDRVQRAGPIEPREALAICAELCEALAEVHAAGIVHRDLKPSNVGLPRSGPVGVKLLDFGLAASMDDAFLSKITQSQQILGSLPYMAPEQFNGAEPAPSMDVYAVGVVLYEAMTGRLPFFAPSTAAMIHQILAAPPPALPETLPGRDLLEPLLERLLAKEAHERFASAAAAGHALREAASALGGARSRSAHPPTRVASEVALPPTQEGRAVESIGFLPTMAMPESGPIVESGTRLSRSHAPPAPPTTTSIAAPPRSRLAITIALVAVVGVLMAIVAGVGVAVVLHVLDAKRDVRQADELPPPPGPAPSTPRPLVPIAPRPTPSEPAAAQPAAAQPAAAQPAEQQVVEQQAAAQQAVEQAPATERSTQQPPEEHASAPEPAPRPPVERPRPREPIATPRPHEREVVVQHTEPAPRPMPPPRPPLIQPAPSRGSTGGDRGIVRTW